MKIFILISLFATSAFACLDPNARLMPTKGILEAYKNDVSFNRCVAKLNKVGARISKTQVFRKNSDLGSVDSISYKLLFTGQDANKTAIRLVLSYDLRKNAFTCLEGVSYSIPRGGCF